MRWPFVVCIKSMHKVMCLELGGGEEEEEEDRDPSTAGFHHSWQPLLSFHGNALQCSPLSSSITLPSPSHSLTQSYLYCCSASSLCCHGDALSPPQCWSAELSCVYKKSQADHLLCFAAFGFPLSHSSNLSPVLLLRTAHLDWPSLLGDITGSWMKLEELKRALL